MQITTAPWKLNYNGELSNQIGEVLGPNIFNELFTVWDQTFDPQTNKTSLGLVLKNVYDQHMIKEVKNA